MGQNGVLISYFVYRKTDPNDDEYYEKSCGFEKFSNNCTPLSGIIYKTD